MFPSKLLPCTLLAMSQCVQAQQLPSAGAQLQHIPPAPALRKPIPQIMPTPPPAAAVQDQPGERIMVRRLRIAGAGIFSEGQLLALAGFQAGSELSLGDLRRMAATIAAFYHRNGYFLAQAFLPQQDIQDGAVTIAVLEGRYGRVTLHNRSAVDDAVANRLLNGLSPGDTVDIAPLETRLLLLSDLPGVLARSTLVPGASVGTSDLIVDLTPGRRLSGSIDVDNAGNRYTGAYRAGATLNLNAPTGAGDSATVRVLSSGAGLGYARLGYQTQVGRASAGIAYSALRYKLRREFAALDARGSATVASVYGSYPLIRSRNRNLAMQLAVDAKRFDDTVGATASTARKTARVLVASLSGEHGDTAGAGALNTYTLAWSSGRIDLQTPALRAFDALSARTHGHYNKLSLNAARQQNLSDTLSVHAAVNGQLASGNLDVSEKMELGGMYGVRAYPEGEAFADQGYVLNLEARMALPMLPAALPGRTQLIGFVDHGSVGTSKSAWSAGPNRRTLSAIGIGVSWTDSRTFIVKAHYARKLGGAAALSSPDAAGRLWIQAIRYL